MTDPDDARPPVEPHAAGPGDEPGAVDERGAAGEPGDTAGEPGPADAEVADAFPPTLREVMVRPQWLGVLLLCLVVAGVFAWLGQWQLARAIDTDPLPPGVTEEVRPLADVTAPGEYLPEPLVGQRVETSGTWVPGDFLIVESRYNDGAEGYWVTGQLRLEGADEPTSIAVAIGWAPTRADAEAAISQLEADASAPDAPYEPITVTGRLISDEGPFPPRSDEPPQTLTRMSPAALLGQWHDTEELNVYRPYLASESAAAGLVDISSPAPAEGSGVNWLNIFYAAEWAVFAGFAFYLWYRLAKDAWEKELEDFEDEHPGPGDGGAEDGARAAAS